MWGTIGFIRLRRSQHEPLQFRAGREERPNARAAKRAGAPTGSGEGNATRRRSRSSR
jgi:hypothetical protein